ncbi:MAG: GDSL-type esterase/lipase family protein [Polyangia bacterium]
MKDAADTSNRRREAGRWSWKKRLAYGALTLVLIVAIGECSLRIAGAVLRPEVDTSSPEDDCEAIVLIAHGDSMTFGLGAERRQSYPMQLRRLLAERYPGIAFKAHNLSMPGSNTSEGLRRTARFFEKHPRAAPDFSLVMYGVNNRWNLHNASFWEWEKNARRDHLASFIASNFQLGKAISVALQGGEEKIAEARSDYRGILEDQGWSVFFNSFEDELLSDWISHDLEKFASIAQERGSEPIFLTYFEPRFAHLNPLLTGTADELGVFSIDLERPSRYYVRKKFYCPDLFHLNARGYHDAAKRVLRAFEKHYTREDLERRLADKQRLPVCRER